MATATITISRASIQRNWYQRLNIPHPSRGARGRAERARPSAGTERRSDVRSAWKRFSLRLGGAVAARTFGRSVLAPAAGGRRNSAVRDLQIDTAPRRMAI